MNASSDISEYEIALFSVYEDKTIKLGIAGLNIVSNLAGV